MGAVVVSFRFSLSWSGFSDRAGGVSCGYVKDLEDWLGVYGAIGAVIVSLNQLGRYPDFLRNVSGSIHSRDPADEGSQYI